jgi:ribose/xylose/arabinose/galactoside ABC-type transport system permease subunit
VARSILWLGLAIAALGLALMLLERANIPFGRLPGDFVWKGRRSTFYFPLTSSIIASLVLSILFWLFRRR